MKKINKIKFDINIKKDVFDISMKHDFSPVKVLMVGNKIMAEYAMLMMQNEESSIFDSDVVKMVSRLEELGDIKFEIEEYESNTFNFGKQIIHEVKYNKDYNLKDAFSIISVSMMFMKDNLVTAYGMDSKIYEMEKEEAIAVLSEFERTLDSYKKISDMYGIAGYVYKNFDDTMENLVSNIGYLSEICGEMSDEFLVKESQDIFSEELFGDDEDVPEKNTEYIEEAKVGYNRIMSLLNLSDGSHNHSCKCGCEHEGVHEQECGCEHEGIHKQECGCK